MTTETNNDAVLFQLMKEFIKRKKKELNINVDISEIILMIDNESNTLDVCVFDPIYCVIDMIQEVKIDIPK